MTQEVSNRALVADAVAKVISRMDDPGVVRVTFDTAYDIAWVRHGELVIGLITDYTGGDPGEFALIDCYGVNWSGADYGLTADEAADALVAYLAEGEDRTRGMTNVLVDDGSGDDLQWSTEDISEGIDALLEGQADLLRGEAFADHLATTNWNRAKVYVRLVPSIVPYAESYGARHVFEGDDYEEAVLDELGSHLDVSVLLSEEAIREHEGCDSDKAVSAVLTAVHAEVKEWLRKGNPLGTSLSGADIEVDLIAEEEDDGDHQVKVSVKLDDCFDEDDLSLRDERFVEAAEPLEETLEVVVTRAVSKAVAEIGAKAECC